MFFFDVIELYEEIFGYGIFVKVNGIEIFVGNKKFMEREQIEGVLVLNVGIIVYIVVD